MLVTVVNLSNPSDTRHYTCSPREAVIAAHAQSLLDWNTWDYETKYGSLVVTGQHTIACGDFCVSLRARLSNPPVTTEQNTSVF
jgi:hypothetical protein